MFSTKGKPAGGQGRKAIGAKVLAALWQLVAIFTMCLGPALFCGRFFIFMISCMIDTIFIKYHVFVKMVRSMQEALKLIVKMDFLHLLLSSIKRVYTYEQIYRYVWKEDINCKFENYTIWCLAARVRKKLRMLDVR